MAHLVYFLPVLKEPKEDTGHADAIVSTRSSCTLLSQKTYHSQEHHLLFSLSLGFLTLVETSPNLKTKKWLFV